MAEMMLDGMHGAAELLLGQVALQIARDVGTIAAMAQPLDHVARRDAGGQHIGKLAPAVGLVVAVDGDMGHIAQANARFLEAVANRFAGKAAPVLDAAEALFLAAAELAVLTSGRGIM